MIWRIVIALLFAALFSGGGVVILLGLRPAFGLVWALGLGAAFLWWHARRDRPRRRALIRMRRPRGSPRLMVMAGAATMLVAFGVAGLIEAMVSSLHDMDMAPWQRLIEYADTLGGWIALTAFVALAVPLVEEFCFRGHIQHTLERRYPPWVAVLVTTALFTVVHISPAHSSLLLIPLVLGLGMGIVTVLFQSIWVAVLIHAVWNLTMSFQGALYDDAPTDPVAQDWLLWLALIPLALGLAGWLMVLREGRYRALMARRNP
jgi:membrane protease YdiL (CAAX protease family)